MKYITRNLEKVVNQVTKEYPVVLVTGPRQVGKTTMLQKLMEGTDRDHDSGAFWRLWELYFISIPIPTIC